jgi:hypothetical protein
MKDEARLSAGPDRACSTVAFDVDAALRPHSIRSDLERRGALWRLVVDRAVDRYERRDVLQIDLLGLIRSTIPVGTTMAA